MLALTPPTALSLGSCLVCACHRRQRQFKGHACICVHNHKSGVFLCKQGMWSLSSQNDLARNRNSTQGACHARAMCDSGVHSFDVLGCWMTFMLIGD